jgi:hypothetical protein
MGPATANLPVKGFPKPYIGGSLINGDGTYAYSQYPSG